MIVKIILVVLAIALQPAGAVNWVSTDPQTVTEYSYVHQWGVEAYLAHDYLAGEVFKSLELGDVVFVDGQGYQVSEIMMISPTAEGEVSLFERFYGDGGIGDGRLVLQTCDGEGFYFVLADPTGEMRGDYSGRFVVERPVTVKRFR